MRSIRLMAVSTLILAGALACGDGGSVGPNTPPVAAFTPPTCTPGVPCQFTDASTDADGSISTRSWEFGDPTSSTNTSTDANPSHTFAAAGSYSVKLTVTDNAGATGTVTNAVTVGAAGNLPPTASFEGPTSCTAGTPCGFHSTSTDADGQIASAVWDFGDLGTGEGLDATHTYAAAGTYNVTLTVTDNGGATGTATESIIVSPPASQDCTTSGTLVDCSLGITQAGTVRITIVSEACELAGNKLTILVPGQAEQTAFFNLCNRTVGETYTVKDAAGLPLVFQPGSTLPLRFHQGPQGTNPPVSDPGIRITGSSPNWTLNVDDGGNAGAAGEPDFNDVVLTVQAGQP